MVRTARDFPAVSAAIEDPEIRALFTQRFLAATEIYDDLVDAACWKLLGDIGARPGSDEKEGEKREKKEEEILAKVPERARPVVRYMIAKLTDAGYLPGTGAHPEAVSVLAAELASAEPDAAVGAEIVSLLAEEGPAFLRGEKSGEEILFSPTRLPLWIRYFSNANILYAINNALGAETLARVLPASGAEVLEVGGGCGSAAEAALARLGARVGRWRFTELVPTFARRGERAARAAASPGTLVEAAKLDMTKPWAEQGVAPGSFDAVYSVNCFHVAPDLGFVLAEAKASLKPGGVVVVSESVKPGAHPPPSYVDFVFDFLTSFTDVRTDPVLRPNHGFLSPSAWRASFAAAGFHDVEVLPDVDAVAAKFPKFFVGAVVARR
jgi:SAM-dependent methyltransferase